MTLRSLRRGLGPFLALMLMASPSPADLVKQSSTAAVPFLVVSTTDGTTGVTGATPVVTTRKPGTTSYVASGGTVTETGSGNYLYTYSTTETATCGSIALHIVTTGGFAVDRYDQVVAFDPASATNLGLSFANTLDISSFTADASASIFRGYLATTGGAATSPVTADAEWSIAGHYTTTTGTLATVPYYKAKTLAAFAWTDGTYWYISSTAPGLTLPSGYFKTASGASVVGPYVAQGTATGTPAVAYHGNGILNPTQPTGGSGLTALGDARIANLDAAVSTRSTYAGADTAGTTTLLTRLPSALTIASGKVAATLAAGDSADLTTLLGRVSANVALASMLPANFNGLGIVSGQFTANTLALAPAGTGGGSVTVAGYATGQDPATLLSTAGYTSARAAKLDSLDAAVSSRQSGSAPVTLPTTAPSGYGGSSSTAIPQGQLVAGSTTTSVIVAGLPVGSPVYSYVGQHLYNATTGESRLIGSQAVSGGNYTFTFTATALLPASFTAVAAGQVVSPIP